MRLLFIHIALLSAFALAGCDDDLVDPNQIGRMSAALLSFERCDELEDSLRASLHRDIEAEADSYRYYWRLQSEESRHGGFFGKGGAADDALAGAAPPESSTNHYTGTNTQTLGVDEPDVLKTDGEFIYIVNSGEVGVFRAWPPEELAKIESLEASERGSAELLLTPDHLVVISAFFAEPKFIGGFGGAHAGESADLPSPAYDYASDNLLPFYAATHTRIRIYERPEDPSGAHQLISDRVFEGKYISARRHGETIRLLLESRIDLQRHLHQNGLALPSPWAFFERGRRAERRYNAELDRLVEEAKAYVDALSLAELLPHELIVSGSEAEEPARLTLGCDRVYTPEPDQRELDLLSVLTFSLDEPKAVDQIAIFGGSRLVYASHDRLISSRHGWHYDPETGAGEERSVLHSFLLNDRSTRYEASGILEGGLRNQFSLDVHEGIVRAAISYRDRSSINEAGGGVIANKLVTLKPEGGKLVRLGETPPLAPNETIFAVRFMGDYGYIVTFRQVDPLFAIDLRDPSAPKVLGELKIPGFSTYMHPLTEDHLLTIGRDIDEYSGVDQGLQLQIFDISEKTTPRRIHQRVLAHTYSSAEHNHKAFVYDPRSRVLLIAAERYDGYSNLSTLELFSISIERGIQPFGSVRHNAPLAAQERIERGLLIENFVYSLGTENLFVHTLAQPPERIGYVGRTISPSR